jgi:hypothetical protein
MKLLFCKKCYSIFNLSKEKKTCVCGETSGYYTDNLNAVFSGDSIPLGFNNTEFVRAINNQPDIGWGRDFTAFVISKKCDTFKGEAENER